MANESFEYQRENVCAFPTSQHHTLKKRKRMTDFSLKFDMQPFEELDQFALLACQKYNYGNNNNWFGVFRGGLYGFYARIHGVKTHYFAVHSWMPRPRMPSETEYHIASIFFNMDSSIECIAFALNALGFGTSTNDLFRDVTKAKELRKSFTL